MPGGRQSWRASVGIALVCACCALWAWPGRATGQTAAEPDAIRIWGSPEDRPMLLSLEQAFRRRHPEVSIRYHLYGPESTLAGVYTGVADLAVMAREVREPMERMAFEWALLSKPFEVAYAHGGFDPCLPGAQLAIFVNAANPLPSLSLADLDGILGTEHRRGGRTIRAWPQLANSGKLPGPIHIYGPPVDSVAAVFIRRRVMLDSRKWNRRYRQLATREQVLSALANDAAGLAIASAGDAPVGVRAIALSLEERGKAVLPTRESVIDGSYPLARVLSVVVDRPAGKALRPVLVAYLRFLLGEEAQALLVRDGRHLPLSRADAQLQLTRLAAP